MSDAVSEQELRFDVEGAAYEGRLRLAAGSTRLAVLLPGSGPQDPDVTIGPNRFFLELATGLADRGVSSLRMGKAQVAGASRAVLDYRHEYVEPVRALIGVASAFTDLVARPVLVGHSLGGHVAPFVASELGNVEGVALVNAHISPLTEILEDQLRRTPLIQEPQAAGFLAAVDRARAAPVPPAEDMLGRYLWHAHRHDPVAYLTAWPRGLLVLQAQGDLHVPPAEAVRWIAAAAATDIAVRCRLFPGLDHLAMPSRGNTLLAIAVGGKLDDNFAAELAGWIEPSDA